MARTALTTILLALLGTASSASESGPGEDAAARARSLGLARDPGWLRLLHYQPKLPPSGSEIAAGGFFLSPTGRRDSQAELDATLRAFVQPASPGQPDQHALCRFPARRAWLEERLGPVPGPGGSAPGLECPRYAAWREDLHASTLTLVFASAYLNNPSSMYGHTFLRLDRAAGTSDGKLLDYAVNFAADTGDDNGVLFAVYGLAGLYPGRYSVMPYYLKVQEYSNMESRDLWEYELRLGSAAVERLLAHLWEMEGAVFPYYFFNKNCSYQLLPLLEAADPGLDLVRRWEVGVIPVETLRRLTDEPGRVAGVSFRPSRMTALLARRARLTAAEARLAARLVRGDEGDWTRLEKLPRPRQALVLESGQDYLEHRTDFRRQAEEAAAASRRRILLARSRLGGAAAGWSPPRPEAPHLGHKTTRLSLGWGAAERPFLEVAGRAALHDLLDPPRGYAPDSTLEMFGFRLRHRPSEGRTWLQAADLVRIFSLAPYDPWFLRPSWTVDSGLRTASELDLRGWKAGYYGLGLGSGLAWQSRVAGRELLYALMEADAGVGGIFRGNHRIGGGPLVALALHPSGRFAARAQAGYRAYFLGDPRPQGKYGAEAAFHLTRDASLRLRIERVASYEEAFVGLNGFF